MSVLRFWRDLTFQYPCSRSGGNLRVRHARFPSRSGGNLKEGGTQIYFYPPKTGLCKEVQASQMLYSL
jgi:hypothetical protein